MIHSVFLLNATGRQLQYAKALPPWSIFQALRISIPACTCQKCNSFLEHIEESCLLSLDTPAVGCVLRSQSPVLQMRWVCLCVCFVVCNRISAATTITVSAGCQMGTVGPTGNAHHLLDVRGSTHSTADRRHRYFLLLHLCVMGLHRALPRAHTPQSGPLILIDI